MKIRVKDTRLFTVHWLCFWSFLVNWHDGDWWKYLREYAFCLCVSLSCIQPYIPSTTHISCIEGKEECFFYVYLFFLIVIFLDGLPRFLLHVRPRVQYEAIEVKSWQMFWINWSCWPFYHFLLQLEFHDREGWKFTKQKISFRPWKFECNYKCLLHFFGWNPTYIRNISANLFKIDYLFFIFIYFFPNQRSNYHPLKWKHSILTTELPGKSLYPFSQWKGELLIITTSPGQRVCDHPTQVTYDTESRHRPSLTTLKTCLARLSKTSELSVAEILEKIQNWKCGILFDHISLFGTFKKFYLFTLNVCYPIW